MLGFNHVLAGSIAAVIVPAPLVPIVAFASHFVLDAFPHFQFSDGKTPVFPYTRKFRAWLAFDAIMCVSALAFSITLLPETWPIICVGAFFSTLPDFLWLLHGRADRIMEKFFDFATYIQWGERTYGWIFEAFYGFVMIVALFHLAN